MYIANRHHVLAIIFRLKEKDITNLRNFAVAKITAEEFG